jgi:ADP-L-glycero-D-manno-heptose 6-epimerase
MDKAKLNGLFNIGSGKARTWNDLVSAVFAAMGKKSNIEYIDMPEQLRNQYQYFTQAPIDKLHKASYKKPITPLKEAVKDYVQNYLDRDQYLSGN